MTALLILIPAALLLGALGLFAFLWSLRAGQYDDLDGAAVRILDDSHRPGEVRMSGSVARMESSAMRGAETRSAHPQLDSRRGNGMSRSIERDTPPSQLSRKRECP
jgi:cbb3-type cytochrome oxidase maturation protein